MASARRIYVDTSVFGGPFDEEFAEPSRQFFDEARAGRFTLLVSPVTRRELRLAPAEVRRLLSDLPATLVEELRMTRPVVVLRNRYIATKILTSSQRNDATHVAIATVSAADLLVSWNFHDLVNLDRIKRYNAVNVDMGYQRIEIRTPREALRAD